MYIFSLSYTNVSLSTWPLGVDVFRGGREYVWRCIFMSTLVIINNKFNSKSKNTKYLRSRFCLLSISFLVCAGGFFHLHWPFFLSPFDNAILFEDACNVWDVKLSGVKTERKELSTTSWKKTIFLKTKIIASFVSGRVGHNCVLVRAFPFNTRRILRLRCYIADTQTGVTLGRRMSNHNVFWEQKICPRTNKKMKL